MKINVFSIAVSLAYALVLIALISLGQWAFAVGLSTQTTEPWYIQYFFNLLAIFIAPLSGFMAGQFYKVSQETKPHPFRTAAVAGGVTAVFAAMLWPGDWSEAGKIGLTIGSVQPLIVWAWFAVASRFAPKQAERLKGNNGELTVLPWLKVKKQRTAKVVVEGEPLDYEETQVMTDAEKAEITRQK